MVRRLATLAVTAGLLAGLGLARPAEAGPALVFDPANAQVLYAEDPDLAWYPASLTKLMTAYLTFEALKAGKLTWESRLVTSEKAHVAPPSKIGLHVGGEMTIEQGIRALIIKSANDVAIMLAEKVSGSEEAFVELMNTTAKRLGMSRTRFTNPNGLPDPGQVTTARDMGLLARAILVDYPQLAPLFAEHKTYIGRIRLGSHNSLLKTFEGADGMKTGFICSSGYNVVASATREGRRLVAVVLGETSALVRNQRAALLLEHGFEHQAWKAALAPVSLDQMAFAPAEVAEAVDLRKLVRAWQCGNRGAGPRPRPPKVAGAKGKKGQAQVQQAAQPGAATQGPQGSVATQARVAPAAAVKRAATVPAPVPAAAPQAAPKAQ
jgi:D-alanyl-D-alanine carboxypeptidase